MKKIVLSVLLACSLLISMFIFAGCKSDTVDRLDEIETKLSQHEASIGSSAQQAADDLKAAKTALEAAILEGDQAGTTALTAAVADLNTAIEKAKTAAADAVGAAKAELESAIATADTALLNQIKEQMLAAKAALEAAIAAGDEAGATALTNAVAELQAAVDAAKAAASAEIGTVKASLEAADETLRNLIREGDATNIEALAAVRQSIGTDILHMEDAIAEAEQKAAEAKAALEAAIAEAKQEGAAALAAAKAALEEAIAAGDEANATALAQAKADLEAAIAAGDEANAAALTEAREAVVAAIAAVQGTAGGAMQLEPWNAMTEEVLKAFDTLNEKDDAFNYALYSAAEQEKIYDAYDEAQIRLLRAPSKEAADAAIAAFVEATENAVSYADEIKAKQDAAKALLDQLKASLETLAAADPSQADYQDIVAAADQLDQDTVAALAAAQELLDAADAVGSPEVTADIASAKDRQTTLQNEYAQLFARMGGLLIKHQMDEVHKGLITADTDLTGLRAKYDEWALINDVADVEGFAETVANFVADEVRVEALQTAKTEAEAINDRSVALKAEIEASGPSATAKGKLDELNANAKTWDEMYFAAPYDVELPGDKYPEGSSNFQMLDHDAWQAARDVFENLIASFNEKANIFLDALQKLDTINLLSNDEVQAALDAYNNWVVEERLCDFNYLIVTGDVESTPSQHYDNLMAKCLEYEKLRAKACSAYDPAVKNFLDQDPATVADSDKDALDAAKKWFVDYGVLEDGNITFDNGEAGQGYYLRTDLTVTQADYDKLPALQEAYDRAHCQVEINALAEAAKVKVNASATLTDEQKDKINGIIDATCATSVNRVKTCEYPAGLEVELALYTEKFAVMGNTIAIYDEYIGKVDDEDAITAEDKDEVKQKMYTGFLNDMNQIKELYDQDLIHNRLTLIPDELNAILTESTPAPAPTPAP